MTDSETIEQTRVAVASLLEALNVERVVYVDDYFANVASIEDVLAASYVLDSQDLLSLVPEFEGNVPDDQEVRNQMLRTIWEGLDAAERASRSENVFALSRMDDGEEIDDMGDASILRGIIPEGKLTTLSPSQWSEQREQLIDEGAGRRTLFLFDQDFTKDGGDPQGGIKIIASLLATEKNPDILCGLLTHTVTPENQSDQWLEMSSEHSISQDRFVIIPKLLFSRDPLSFAHLLKLVALSPDFSELKIITQKIIKAATSVAAEEVEKIRIDDLDHIVFRSSEREGLWEPDLLFRLHSLFHRAESRKLAHDGGALEALARKLRLVSHIPTSDKYNPAPSTWKIQRQELYETGDYINKNHLPLELGDIFEKIGTGSTKRYIVLAQPCDLMLRGNGKRVLEHITLAEVVPKAKASMYEEEMVYFGEVGAERWFVKLKQVHHIKSCVLDLCSFNSTGAATIQYGAAAPLGLRPSLNARFVPLSKIYDRLVRRLNVMTPQVGDAADVRTTKESIRKELAGNLLDEGLFRGDMVNMAGVDSISYNCRRISRLSRERAFGLLMAHTSCLSRPAYELEFGGSAVS